MDRVWIFDLDDTLHDASRHIFPHINRAMTHYLMTHLALDEDAACSLRRDYWLRYGATLNGMMRHHGTDPHHFLHHTHQFPDLAGMVLKNPALRTMLRRLPGRKVIFTNAPMGYALRVLELLRIRDQFERVFSIESSGFRPKPMLAGFMQLLQQLGVPAARCVMVEDTPAALRTAKRLGMKTVYISQRGSQQQRLGRGLFSTPGFVDVRLNSVLALPNITALR